MTEKITRLWGMDVVEAPEGDYPWNKLIPADATWEAHNFEPIIEMMRLMHEVFVEADEDE